MSTGVGFIGVSICQKLYSLRFVNLPFKNLMEEWGEGIHETRMAVGETRLLVQGGSPYCFNFAL